MYPFAIRLEAIAIRFLLLLGSFSCLHLAKDMANKHRLVAQEAHGKSAFAFVSPQTGFIPACAIARSTRRMSYKSRRRGNDPNL